LYAPITTRSSLNTSNIGIPDTSLTLIKLPLNESDIPNNVPEFPINDIPPSCNTSNFIDDDKLPENAKNALLLVFVDLSIIEDAVTDPVIDNAPVINIDPLISSVADGVIFPIPTKLPVLNILDSVNTEPLLNLAT
jgi:hypothetical protein